MQQFFIISSADLSNIIKERIFVASIIIFIIFSILLFRAIQLQVIEFDTYHTQANKNRIQIESTPPMRGLIFDTNGKLLAGNTPVFSLNMVVELSKPLDKTLGNLSDLLPLSEEERKNFQQRLKKKRRPYEPVLLKIGLEEEEIAIFSANQYRFPGIAITSSFVRHYPYNEITAHSVGSLRRMSNEDYQNTDKRNYSATHYIGKLGLEQNYEDILHGTVGLQKVESDATGRIRQVLSEEKAIPGANLHLYLDIELQKATHEILGDRRGAAVAIDPNTGGILALVSTPSYNPNLFIKGIDQKTYNSLLQSKQRPLFNRATTGRYAAGSTIKPFIGLAGINYNIITWNTIIEDKGYYKLPNEDRLFRDWNWQARNNAGGHGRVSLNRAIYRSSNVFFYDLGYRLGIDKIHEFLDLFGFGKQTSLDILSASSGLLPESDWKRGKIGQAWFPGDTLNLSIGQGYLLATPLQLATAVAIIANKGNFIPPRLLKHYSYADEKHPLPSDITAIQTNNLRSKDWDLMTKAMVNVIHKYGSKPQQNGTAWVYIGRDIEYKMAGKSGTAQVVGINQNEVYDESKLSEFKRKHAWFIAFAPSHAPKIAVAVIIENGGGGSKVAAPVARAMIDHYLLSSSQTNS